MNAKEIVTKTFEKAKFNGYKSEDVDEYLRDVSVEFKKLQNENAELEKKLEVLATKIREYRNDEEALRDALLIAKKQGIQVVNEAKEEAEKINKEAKDKADKTKKDADDYSAKKKAESDKALADAKAEAKRIVDEANAKADEIHTIMMQQTEREQIVLQRTRKEVSEYTSKILAAYNAHIDYIKGIPAQCENEFVINTAKEVESRKPADSAFAKPAAKPEEKHDEPFKAEPAKPEEKKPEENKPEEKKPEENKPEEKKPEENKPEEKKPEETKPEENKPEENKSEEKKPEENKPDDSKPWERKTDSILFKLSEEKTTELREPLEFGKK
ncbi:MAG: DivIVA domain-containing protein [Eubacterium sp.]|nr:DivIVA domain-containing protein [Eubacterium sp.]